jgi:ubiquinone/menaquinone biosynthesis C-methylase UbiE
MQTDKANIRAHEYELGHSDWELKRLETQARLVNPFTRQYFRDAGIEAGMRVLDIGSGGGDTALLAADIVGDQGEVVGIDRSPVAVAAAQLRIERLGRRNVAFRVGAPEDTVFEGPFDAVVGRYVLMFNVDPVAMLRAAARHVRRGGVVVFHEVDWRGFDSDPPAPIYDRCCRWIIRLFEAVGSNVRARHLYRTFLKAGLPPPTMGQCALIGGAASPLSGLDLIADLVVTMAAVMQEHGIIEPGDVDPATVKQRMLEEAARLGSVVVGRSEVGAWSRVL